MLKQDDDLTSPKTKRQRSVATTSNELKAESECCFVDETVETTRRHRPAGASVTPSTKGSLALNCHGKGWPEYEAVQNGDALFSQPSPNCDDRPTPEHLTYTALSELLAPIDSPESTPDTT